MNSGRASPVTRFTILLEERERSTRIDDGRIVNLLRLFDIFLFRFVCPVSGARHPGGLPLTCLTFRPNGVAASFT